MTAAQLLLLHGSTPLDFMRSSVDVYLSSYDGTVMNRFIGQTEAEKVFSPSLEFADWYTGSPQVLFISRVKKAEYNMKFQFKQVGDPVLLGLALNGELDTSDPDSAIIFLGSNPPAPLECVYRFVGELDDGGPIQLVFRRGIVRTSEDITFGSGDFTSVPMTVSALKDDTECDKQRDMVYICMRKLAVPSGGFVDPCADDLVEACAA